MVSNRVTLRVHAVTLISYTPALTLSGIVYTDAASNRNGFMTSKPHRKRHGFEVFTRNLSNRLGQTKKCFYRDRKSHVRYFPFDEPS